MSYLTVVSDLIVACALQHRHNRRSVDLARPFELAPVNVVEGAYTFSLGMGFDDSNRHYL